MWTAEDKKTAESAAHSLAKLQGRTDRKTLGELEAIRDQVVNKRLDEHERAEAWLSICHLVKRLDDCPDGEDVPGLWHRALQATNAWRGSMK